MMGANNSTRKLTLVNDEKAGVIKLSESLAHRLRGQMEREKSHEKDPIPASTSTLTPIVQPPSSQEHLKISSPIQEITEDKSHQASIDSETTNAQEYNIPPWSSFAKDAHLFASRLREEKDVELKLKDDEWLQKFKQREQEFIDMAKLTQTQMNDAMKEVELLFRKVSCTPVCQDQQENVMKCYLENSSQSLRCADEVENFARCVDLNRFQLFMKESTT